MRIFSQDHISKTLTQLLCEELAQLIEVFAMTQKAIKHGRVMGFAKKVFLGRDEKVKVALDDLNRLIADEAIIIGAEQLVRTQSVQRTVDETRNAVNKLADSRRTQVDLNSILYPSTMAQDWYDRINHARTPGTVEWITYESAYNSWLNGDKPILWIAGPPEVGKSFIASRIISSLLEHVSRIRIPVRAGR